MRLTDTKMDLDDERGAASAGGDPDGQGEDRLSTQDGQRGQQSTPELTPAFDARSIPEFDGTGNVVDWLEQAAVLCGLRQVSLMAVLPTRLRGGAFAVWSRMPPAKRCDLASVKAKLFKAFAMDPFSAHAELVRRRLKLGETADVYLAALQQLAELMGGLPERAIAIFFVNGLPEAARAAVRDSIGETFGLEQVLDRARSVLSRATADTDPTAAAAVAAARGPSQRSSGGGYRDAEPTAAAAVAAARGPSQRSGGGYRGAARQLGPVRCWVCGRLGHIARVCPNGNGGGATSAQVPLPPTTVPVAEHQ